MSESHATGCTRGVRCVARRGRTGATRCSAVQRAASGVRRVAAGACAYCTPTRRFRATRRSSSPSHSALLHRAACCTPACCTVRRVALRPVAQATGRTPPCCTPGLVCAGTTRCSATRRTCGVLIIDWSHIRHGALRQTGPLQRVGGATRCSVRLVGRWVQSVGAQKAPLARSEPGSSTSYSSL